MGILTDHTALEVTADGDSAALRDVISAIGSVDGKLDEQERAVVHALFHTVPQLRSDPATAPPRGRAQILADLGKLKDERLQRQCFVVAVELAIASDGVNEAEDQYLGQLKKALRIDDAFAASVVQVMAVKYARATEG
jgi:uncharacterized membrane protein YebE (DUF533 family)